MKRASTVRNSTGNTLTKQQTNMQQLQVCKERVLEKKAILQKNYLSETVNS